ncbi:hypothetical protein OIU77_022414, partial [Salix suchowensis]
MEWYSGSGIDDFVVPEDQEVYDRLPSPKSWSKWCRDASESHEFSNDRFLMDSKSTEEEVKFNGEILSNEVGSLYNGVPFSRIYPGMKIFTARFIFLPKQNVAWHLLTIASRTRFQICKVFRNDAHGMGSSRYLKTHAFSPSLSWEEGEVAASHFNPCNSDQRDLAPVK